MPCYVGKGRSRGSRVQARVLACKITASRGLAWWGSPRFKNGGQSPPPFFLVVLTASLALAGCSDPLSKPVDLFHDLEGGQIAAERPPPPGAGQPYPHIGTVPARPVVPGAGFRTALQSQLAAERDEKERLVADIPVETVPPPPPAAPSTPPAAPGSEAVGSAPSAAAPDTTIASATVSAADAPAPPAPATISAVPPPLPKDAALQIVGDPIDMANLPLVPDAPPPPATFEGVPSLPAPTPRMLPPPLPLPAGTPVFFANGSAVLAASQKETLGDINGRRKKNQSIDIVGLGEAESDSPIGQEAAIDLGLRRARAIADALAAMHVPQGAMHIAARPFGRGALLRLIP